MRNPYQQLEKNLGHRFRRRKYLEIALTHRSFRFESSDVKADNQRLEFLGDAVLGLVSAGCLFDRFPECQEGELTRIRSRLTNSKTLADIAAAIQLGDFLRLGRGEVQSGGHERASNVSDALEAVIGAAYLDGGMRAVETIFRKLFLPEIEGEAPHDRWHDNPKGALQELCQRRWRSGPRYRTVREDGPAHSKSFTVEVIVGGRMVGTGRGANKREAQMEAARHAFQALGHSRQER